MKVNGLTELRQIMHRVLPMLFLLLHAELGIVLTFEPVSTAAAVSGAVVSAALAGFNFFHCRVGECCDDRWITANITGELYLQLMWGVKRFALSIIPGCRN